MSSPNTPAVRNGSAATMTPNVPAATRVGQGTAVEQSRAVATVEAQFIIARRFPRDQDKAVSDMLRSCAMKTTAEKAFFTYKRGGQVITRPSVHLAREIARCWGNVDYGIAELRRDDQYGQSEMRAYALDLETNATESTIFIVPHIRDTKNGTVRIGDVRDIYENNANMGARRVREMILDLLPPWYVEAATTACYRTLQEDNSDGATLAERADTAVARFAQISVSLKALEAKVGAPKIAWQTTDLARLGIIYRSVERGETRKEDEFPAATDGVTGDEILNAPKVPADAGPAGSEQAPAQQPKRQRRAQSEQPAPDPEDPGPADPGPANPPAQREQGQQSGLDWPSE